MVIEVFIFLVNDCFLQLFADLAKFSIHSPFVITGQEGMDKFVICRDDGAGVFDIEIQGMHLAQHKEYEQKDKDIRNQQSGEELK